MTGEVHQSRPDLPARVQKLEHSELGIHHAFGVHAELDLPVRTALATVDGDVGLADCEAKLCGREGPPCLGDRAHHLADDPLDETAAPPAAVPVGEGDRPRVGMGAGDQHLPGQRSRMRATTSS